MKAYISGYVDAKEYDFVCRNIDYMYAVNPNNAELRAFHYKDGGEIWNVYIN